MVRILIADDHTIVRQGLRHIVERASGLNVVGEAASGAEALEMVRKQRYDLVVLDISMPDMSGIEILKQMRKERPDVAVLILSIHPEEQYAVRTLRAGASGYVTKSTAGEELIEAIRTIAGGRKYISRSTAEIITEELETDHERLPHTLLSDREFQVLRLIASGRPVKEIALELHLSAKTVSTYRSRILEKMRKSSNAELTRYAFEHSLVD